MRPPGFIPATFSFTPRAVAKIRQLRHDIETKNGEPLGATGFAWAHVTLNDGSRGEGPMIGFYQTSQMDAVAQASVQTVDGVDLIVFSTPDQARSFDGRTIDFAEGNGFFLAEP